MRRTFYGMAMAILPALNYVFDACLFFFSSLSLSRSRSNHLLIVVYIFTQTILRTIALFRCWTKVKSTVDSTHKMWITFIISAEYWPFGRASATIYYPLLLVQLLFGCLIYFSVTNIYAIWTVLSTTYSHVWIGCFTTECFWMMVKSSVPYSTDIAVLAVTFVCVCVCAKTH